MIFSKKHIRQQAFTLIELLVSVAGFSLICVGVIALVSNLAVGTNRQQGFLYESDTARRLTFGIMQELRNAVISNTGAYPLVEASAQQIIFYSNVDGGADIERLRYFLQNGQLKRGIVKPTGSPLVYNLGSETISTVQRNVSNGVVALFEYFDGSYTGSGSSLPQPVSVTAVRHVKLNLMISKTQGGIVGASYTVSASASVRNLKDNLGN